MSDNKMHVLVGIHTSGKTSIGLKLSEVGFIFSTEIATELIGKFDTPLTPWKLSPSFDEIIMSREFERDETLLYNSQIPFVETWHIGNLAYASVVSHKRLELFLPFFRERGNVLPG